MPRRTVQAPGHAYAENEDEERVIVDMEGNIVMVQR